MTDYGYTNRGFNILSNSMNKFEEYLVTSIKNIENNKVFTFKKCNFIVPEFLIALIWKY